MRTIHKSENVIFNYDPDHSLCYVKWKGKVPTDDFRKAIETGADLIRNQKGFTNILLDRQDLDEFSTESRVWLKQDFMKNDGKVLVKKVKKLAAVKPSTTLATVMTTVFSAVFQIANPNLEYQVFETKEEAIAWVKTKDTAGKKRFLSRVISMFQPATEVEQG